MSSMAESDGIKMRIIALDELMKCIAEIGRTVEDPSLKDLLRKLHEAAKTRQQFLAASRTDTD